MDRINTSTKATDLFGAGKHGFKDGNLALGVAATDFNAAWFNDVQEELVGVIESAGLTPTAGVRNQLSLAIAARIQSLGVPSGAVSHFAMSAAPTGWLKANGAAISRTTYAALFAVVGTTFGVGDGSTTFNIPDLRAEFLRGWDDGRGVDAGRVFGTTQTQMLQDHTHLMRERSSSAGVATGDGYLYGTFSAWGTGGVVGATAGAETRPRNVALLACIKF